MSYNCGVGSSRGVGPAKDTEPTTTGGQKKSETDAKIDDLYNKVMALLKKEPQNIHSDFQNIMSIGSQIANLKASGVEDARLTAIEEALDRFANIYADSLRTVRLSTLNALGSALKDNGDSSSDSTKNPESEGT